MPDLQPVKIYYDQIAYSYDTSRFGNSYGRYLHAQEVPILQKWLGQAPPQSVLDLGCGTGRFGQFARTGVDFSGAMLSVASQNHPGNQYIQADIRQTGLPDSRFKAIFCLHVLMHLEKGIFPEIWQEVHRLLQPGGHFIFDAPSAARRQVSKPGQVGWHAATTLTISELNELNVGIFTLEKTQGVLIFPIHRLPSAVRGALLPLDCLLGKTPLQRWASYQFFMLQKKQTDQVL